LQSASGRAVDDRSKRGTGTGSAPPTRARRRALSPATIAIIALLAVVSLGAMLAPILGIYPPKESPPASVECHPTQEHAAGLKAEVVGQPRQEGDNVIVRVRVTNQVMKAPPVEGTPHPSDPTPAPEPANLNYGSVKAFLYNRRDAEIEIVGSGVGNVGALQQGASMEIDVYITPVENFSQETQVQVCSDTVWTDRDPVKAPDSDAGDEPIAGTPTP
jgi:hypothetical protein